MNIRKKGKGAPEGRSNNGKFIRLPKFVYNTLAFKTLCGDATKLWIAFMEQHNGTNNGKLCAIYSQMDNRGWSQSKHYRLLKQLQDRGFITKTRQGGIGSNGKLVTYYRMNHLPTDDLPEIGVKKSPPILDYQEWPHKKKITYCRS